MIRDTYASVSKWLLKGCVYKFLFKLFYSGLTQNGVIDMSHSNFTSTKFTGAPDIVKLCCLRMVYFTVFSPVFLSRFLDNYSKDIMTVIIKQNHIKVYQSSK